MTKEEILRRAKNTDLDEVEDQIELISEQKSIFVILCIAIAIDAVSIILTLLHMKSSSIGIACNAICLILDIIFSIRFCIRYSYLKKRSDLYFAVSFSILGIISILSFILTLFF